MGRVDEVPKRYTHKPTGITTTDVLGCPVCTIWEGALILAHDVLQCPQCKAWFEPEPEKPAPDPYWSEINDIVGDAMPIVGMTGAPNHIVDRAVKAERKRCSALVETAHGRAECSTARAALSRVGVRIRDP